MTQESPMETRGHQTTSVASFAWEGCDTSVFGTASAVQKGCGDIGGDSKKSQKKTNEKRITPLREQIKECDLLNLARSR